MADIFISYRRADTPILLEELTRLLRKVGWSVWCAPMLEAGHDLREIIEPELKAAKCVVGLWSKTAHASADVIAEFDYAHRNRTLLPVAIDDVWPPERYRDLAIINLRGFRRLTMAAEIPQLLRAICRLAGLPKQYENTDDLIADFFDNEFRYFKIGNVTIPAKFINGVPTQPYRPEDVTIFDCEEVHEDRASYPAIIRENHATLLDQVARDYDLDLSKLRDNKLPRLDAWDQEPEGENDERGKLQLWFSRTSYFQIWATNVGIDIPISVGPDEQSTTIRETFCVTPFTDLSESVLSNNPGVEVVVISEDPDQQPPRQLILRRRGHKAAGYRGWYQVSASGHVSLGHRDENGAPSPFQTAIAETIQEVDHSLELKPEDFKLIGISLKAQDLHPSFYGYMMVNRPAEELVDAISRDKYEGPKLAIPFTPQAVFETISAHRWIPQSAMALIATLQAFFPRDEVMAAAKSIPVKPIDDFKLLDNRGRD
jgi:hypothetical protein